MTYYGAKEVAAAYRTVRGNTITIAEEIPEENYGFSPAPSARTVAQTLVHIVHANRFPYEFHRLRMDKMEGFNFMDLLNEAMAAEKNPPSKAAILGMLRTGGEEFATWLESLSEDFLGETIQMMPGAQPAVKSRFEMIIGAKEHEMHHRGQLMTMQRMLGMTNHLTRQRDAMMAQFIAAAQAAKK